VNVFDDTAAATVTMFNPDGTINPLAVKIIGDQSFADIDLNKDSVLSDEELRVYYTILFNQTVKSVYFEPMYSINCTTRTVFRRIPNLVERFAPALNYSIYYEPAYYSFRLFDI
jgi:hypothetical protein